MVSVGDFCSVGTASDLLVVEAMWKQRGGVVRLCKLSNGLQLALPEERLTLSTDPVGAFRKHMDKIVRASRKSPGPQLSPCSNQILLASLQSTLPLPRTKGPRIGSNQSLTFSSCRNHST